MKKTLVACLAVAALFAIATSASAITCTIDTRPAATLLLPYFEATFNPDGTILATGANAVDTLVTIGNASSAPMMVHVNVFSERSELVLDFNIALTGFDIQSFSMASILRGFLPQTGYGSPLHDGCQRNNNATAFPDESGGGFIRVDKAHLGAPTQPADNINATSLYPDGPFSSAFLFDVLDSLDTTPDSRACPNGGGTDGVITGIEHGYVTMDHANYCSLSNPSDPKYYTNDAIGMENNLFGDYIYTSGGGIGTGGFALVAIEADPSLFDETGAPTDSSWTTGCQAGTPDCQGRRTFYRRYVTTADINLCNPLNDFTNGTIHDNDFDCGNGDQREPLGLKYAARWFDFPPNVSSSFDVWRASANELTDLLGGHCTDEEPLVTLNFYDEDENTVSQGVCPSPCKQQQFNFPLETNRLGIATFNHPVAPAGWVDIDFYNATGPVDGRLDQAWVTYDFQGASAFLSAGMPAAQLDPSTCAPLGDSVGILVTDDPAGFPSLPVIPQLVGFGLLQ